MSTITLTFLDENGSQLGDIEVSDDYPISRILPILKNQFDLDPEVDWQLVTSEDKQPLDYQKSFLDVGLTSGSVVQFQHGSRQIDGKYEILEEIARGGMGVVYKVRDHNLAKVFALKTIDPEQVDNQELVSRFRREMQAVAKISEHPNVVGISTSGNYVTEGQQIPYFIMEYVEGDSLDHLIESRNALPLKTVASILDGVASALDKAHQNGIIHRDLKPSNIMLLPDPDHPDSWIPKLADFGLVKLEEPVSDLTRTGAIMGSPHYMSPEQAKGDPLTKQSDIYSLGIVAYEMIVGARPFQNRGSATKIMFAHVNDPPPSLTMYSSQNIPPAVESVLLTALEKNPTDRFESAGEFALAFHQALGGEDGETGFSLPVREILISVSALSLVMLGVWWFALRPPTVRKLLRWAERDLESGQYLEAADICQDVLVEEPENEEALDCLTEAAKGHLDRGDLTSAQEAYEIVLSKAPENSEVNLGMGKVFFSQGQYEESISHYEAVKDSEISASARSDLAWSYYYVERYRDAIPMFNGLTNENPVEAYRGLGLSYYSLGWYEDALEAVSRWVELESTQPEPYQYLGFIYEALGELDRAAEAYERWSQLAEGDLEAQLSFGRVLYDMEKYDRAAEQLEKLAQADPNNSEVHRWLTLTYEALREFSLMLESANRWTKLSPDSADPYRASGWALFYSRDYGNAVRKFDQALAIQKSEGAYLGLYNAYSSMKQYDQALATAQDWLEFATGSVDALNSVGWALYNQQQYEEAVDVFSEAAQLEDVSEVYRGLTSAYYALRDYELALSNAEEWVSLSSENAKAYNQKGWCLFKLEKYDEALMAFSDSLELEKSTAAYSGLVQVYSAQQEYETALSVSTDWINMESENATAYALRGWIHVNMDDCAKAVDDFSDALEINPDLGLAIDGLKRCP
jgi:serine/threonine protein kinase/Flp pilus assembly protein TadD